MKVNDNSMKESHLCTLPTKALCVPMLKTCAQQKNGYTHSGYWFPSCSIMLWSHMEYILWEDYAYFYSST